MSQVKWFDRQFDFAFTQNIFPSIIERLSGTPLRLKAKLEKIPAALLTTRIDNSWTIKENAGHLTDLEPLWQGRYEDILTGQLEMRPTDLQNEKTTHAGHDQKSVDELIAAFSRVRQQTLQLIEQVDEAVIFRYALHPRLKTPMRTIDLFLFVAEHDDHHLARITEITKLAQQNKK